MSPGYRDGQVSYVGNVNVIIVRSAEAKDLITRSSRFRDSMTRVHRGVSAYGVRDCEGDEREGRGDLSEGA